MNKAVAIGAIIAAANAQGSTNSYARGAPPTTQNCSTYPPATVQAIPWGLTVDREFGGCRCRDETRMEWGPNPDQYADTTWACYCLNTDTYEDQSVAAETVAAGSATCPGAAACANDANGRQCGIISECQAAAVAQQQDHWNNETARALQTRDQARIYAKKSMLPDDELTRARQLRNKMSGENRAPARVQISALALRYRAIKNNMIAGTLDKAAFQNAYKKVAAQVATYRAEWRQRQQAIEESWNLVVQRNRSADAYMADDLNKIEEIYEQTLASLADRYGKRIAYFQSLPVVLNWKR